MSNDIIKATIKALEKEFDGCSILIGDEIRNVGNVISTGSLSLDRALGIGGLPTGSVVEIYGKPAVGKTTLALHLIKEAQKQDRLCVFIDSEHALDPQYAETLGIDMSNIYITQPTHAREALTIMDKLIRTSEVGLVILDSVASLGAEEEQKDDVAKPHVALQARLLSQFLRRNISVIHETDTLVVFINQMRYNISSFFTSEFTPGGEAIKYYAHVRIFLKILSQIKGSTGIIGNRISATVTKNKHAFPYKVAEFDFIFGEGIDTYGEIIDLALERGILQRSGSFYKLDDQKIAQGRENCKQFLKESEDLVQELIDRIKNEG